jgi:sporulation protein YlmC with PRC-barrel domain
MRRLVVISCALAATAGIAFAQTSGGSNQPAQKQTTEQGGTSSQKTDKGAIRSASPAASVRMTFYTVRPADMRVSELLGATVHNLNNEEIGEVKDLMLDDGKAVRGVIISVGGFLGIGDRKIAVEPQSLVVMEQNDGTISVTLNTNKEELQKAPQVTDADLDRAGATAGSRSPSSTSSGQPSNQR